MTHTQLTTTEKIMQALNELQEIHGIEYLTYEVLGRSNPSHVRCSLKALAALDQCEYIPSKGGRGHKSIIRRNRNSPGYPSRRDKSKRQIP